MADTVDDHGAASGTFLAASQFAALEPSWAFARTRAQLRSLLVLGALFNRRLYVHDTQLADSPHLIADYDLRRDTELNLYNLLTELIRADVVQVALRDGTYDAVHDTMIPCTSLSDLVSSWQQRDPSSSWVIRPDSQSRLALVHDLDELLLRSAENTRVYPYRDIKGDFMRQVREAFGDNYGDLHNMVIAQGGDFARRYENILNQPWFSHSNIYSLIQESKLRLDHPLAQTHGVFDEAAYAHWRTSRILGCEWSLQDVSYPERLLEGSEAVSVPGDEWTYGGLSEELSKYALAIVEGEGAGLVGSLTGKEILRLRESAQEVFLLQELFETSDRSPRLALARALAQASASYWTEITKYIARTRPNAAREPTRLAIFLREHAPRTAGAAERFFSMGLSAVARIAMALTPLAKEVDPGDRALIAQHVSLDFVFFQKTEAIKELRSIVPLRGWVSVDRRGNKNAGQLSAQSDVGGGGAYRAGTPGREPGRYLAPRPVWQVG